MKDSVQRWRWSSQSSLLLFERLSMVFRRRTCLWEIMYLSPERCAISTSLRSLDLSKDPKDAERWPPCFPDVGILTSFGAWVLLSTCITSVIFVYASQFSPSCTSTCDCILRYIEFFRLPCTGIRKALKCGFCTDEQLTLREAQD